MKVHLSAFADEAAEDFNTQIAVLKNENIPFLELRGLDGKNIADISEEEAIEYKKQLDKSDIKVWSIGSPIGKIKLVDDFKEHIKKAEHIYKLANIFGAKNVRVFSFYTDAPESDEKVVIKRLSELVTLAKEYGLTLCHENEKDIYGDTAQRCLNLLDRIPDLKCVFDPANFVQCGESAESAYRLLKDKVFYYHIKDALLKDGAVVPAGEGDGGIDKIISELNRDAILTLEPHLAEFTGYSQIDNTVLKNKYVFKSNEESFSFAAKSLKKLLAKNSFKEENGVWIK